MLRTTIRIAACLGIGLCIGMVAGNATAETLNDHADVNPIEAMDCMDQVRADYPGATGFTFHEWVEDGHFIADFVIPYKGTEHFVRHQAVCDYEG